MVSKVIKKTPTKSLRDRRTRRRKKNPIRNASAVSSIVVASINKSFHSCHRRLIKIFSKLARIGTPVKNRTPRKQGYQILHKFPAAGNEPVSPRRTLFPSGGNRVLPLPQPTQKRTIFLDVDETLIHSVSGPPPEKFDFVVRPVIDGIPVEFYVRKRPFVDEFLEFLSGKFEIVVFTAGLEEYASLVLNRLDPKEMIAHRLYRDSCSEVDGRLVKDLAGLGRDLSRVMIVDDNPHAYALQPENAIPVRPFTDDDTDDELKRLMEVFEGCEEFEDMRDLVKLYVAEWNEDQRKLSNLEFC